jgi:hypothetical protein
MTLRNPNEPTFWRKQHQPFVSTMLHTYYTRFTVKETRFLKYYFLKLGTRCYKKQELMQLLPNTGLEICKFMNVNSIMRI